jgi:hypothetical protein
VDSAADARSHDASHEARLKGDFGAIPTSPRLVVKLALDRGMVICFNRFAGTGDFVSPLYFLNRATNLTRDKTIEDSLFLVKAARDDRRPADDSLFRPISIFDRHMQKICSH